VTVKTGLGGRRLATGDWRLATGDWRRKTLGMRISLREASREWSAFYRRQPPAAGRLL
jgi:hypothetical protein